jgi:hypothetical protein
MGLAAIATNATTSVIVGGSTLWTLLAQVARRLTFHLVVRLLFAKLCSSWEHASVVSCAGSFCSRAKVNSFECGCVEPDKTVDDNGSDDDFDADNQSANNDGSGGNSDWTGKTAYKGAHDTPWVPSTNSNSDLNSHLSEESLGRGPDNSNNQNLQDRLGVDTSHERGQSQPPCFGQTTLNPSDTPCEPSPHTPDLDKTQTGPRDQDQLNFGSLDVLQDTLTDNGIQQQKNLFPMNQDSVVNGMESPYSNSIGKPIDITIDASHPSDIATNVQQSQPAPAEVVHPVGMNQETTPNTAVPTDILQGAVTSTKVPSVQVNAPHIPVDNILQTSSKISSDVVMKPHTVLQTPPPITLNVVKQSHTQVRPQLKLE